ncbi:MAG: hypothetical protein ACQERS_10355 [Bacteroidota bacterium]
MPHKLLLILFFIITCSCDEGSDRDTTIWVYKMVTDYSNNAPVELSPDKTKIVSIPGELNLRWPVGLIDEYFLGGSMGPNTAYLNLSREEYNELEIKPSPDSLYKLIIEKNPFTEFYQRMDVNGFFRNENGYYGIDTTLINNIIKEGKLTKYFDRIK